MRPVVAVCSYSIMTAWDAELEIRTVLVGLRDVMADIRAGRLPRSRESVQRVTEWALSELSDVERRHRSAVQPGSDERVATLLAESRAEVQGATFHDLADSGEVAG